MIHYCFYPLSTNLRISILTFISNKDQSFQSNRSLISGVLLTRQDIWLWLKRYILSTIAIWKKKHLVGKIFGYRVIKGRRGCGRVGSGRPFRGCRGSTLPIPPSGRPARSSKSHQARAARSQPAQAVREGPPSWQKGKTSPTNKYKKI